MRSMMPAALRLARCFSMALAEMPIFTARAAALNVPSSASKAMIFSLLFYAKTTFSPYFSVIGAEDAKRTISRKYVYMNEKICTFVSE